MLAEIICDKFVDEGRPRDPIRFDQGLNIVMGTKHGANSIGKSTFLLVIDFAFSGSTYAESDDIKRNVGEHAVKFTHRIDGEEYRFLRDVNEAATVWRCGENYVPKNLVSLDEFNKWLLEVYGMGALGGSFRSMTSAFLRVYGKSNLDEKRPLTSYPNERGEESVNRVLQLYDKYAAITSVDRLLKEAREKSKAYSAVCKSGLISSAANRTDYRRNEAHIVELKNDLAELERSSQSGVLELEPVVAKGLANLRQQRTGLARKRGSLIARKQRMDADLELGAYRKTKDFERMREYFPDVNLRQIEDVERFHSSIVSVLDREHSAALKDIERQIDLLDVEIARIDNEISSLQAVPNVSTATLRSYAEISGELQKLEEANDSFDRKSELNSKTRALEAEKKELAESALLEVQLQVNSSLLSLNAQISGPDRAAPCLTFKGARSYDFSIPNDTGTGSQVRGMLLLDYVLLTETPLPVISEDTVSIKQIADEPLLRFLELCARSEKQVFMAIDKAESLDEGDSLPTVIEDNIVLRLSEGHELYGKKWGVASGEDDI